MRQPRAQPQQERRNRLTWKTLLKLMVKINKLSTRIILVYIVSTFAVSNYIPITKQADSASTFSMSGGVPKMAKGLIKSLLMIHISGTRFQLQALHLEHP